MKRLFQIASLLGCLASLCGCGSTPGFEPEEPNDPVLPEISSDSAYVKLCTGGELQITTEPLGRATSWMLQWNPRLCRTPMSGLRPKFSPKQGNNSATPVRNM